MNSDNGNFLMKLIYLCMDHLMHNPKRAIIILFSVFIFTMIVGEMIGIMRNSETAISPAAMQLVSVTAGDHFTLPEINDQGAVDLTPQTEMRESSTPEIPVERTEMPKPTAEQIVFCGSELDIAAGKMAFIDYPGGYSVNVKARYRAEDPNIIVGVLKSGEKIYILEGPVCQSGSTWWKINSDIHKIIGWIPEIVRGKPIIRLRQ